MESKIPKIIHYCWFGNGEQSELIKKCIKTWKSKLPDYTFMLWNENNFDVNSTAWTKESYACKKYAFVSDYVRLEALYKYGGVYLDTDIKLIKSLDPLLNQNAFMGFENGDVLSCGIIGTVPENLFIKECLKYYEKGKFDSENLSSNVNVYMITGKLVQAGLKKDNSEQWINDIHIYPKTYFNPMDFFGNWDKSQNTYCIHMYSGSWLPKDELKELEARRKLLWKLGKAIYVKLRGIKIVRNTRERLRQKTIEEN